MSDYIALRLFTVKLSTPGLDEPFMCIKSASFISFRLSSPSIFSESCLESFFMHRVSIGATSLSLFIKLIRSFSELFRFCCNLNISWNVFFIFHTVTVIGVGRAVDCDTIMHMEVVGGKTTLRRMYFPSPDWLRLGP